MKNEIDGLPVIDAGHSETIHVKDEDIRGASRKAPGGCALARAVCRQLHYDQARIHLGRVYVKRANAKHWVRFITSRPLRTEIIAFDRGGRFMSGEYLLAKPQPTKRLGVKNGGKRKTKYLKTRRRPPTIVQDVRGGPA